MLRFFAILPLLFPAVDAASLDDLTWTVTDGEVTIVSCNRDASGSLEIPERIDEFPVTAIGEKTFSWCDKLTSVSIPNRVSSIEEYAFQGCLGLKEMILPPGLVEIEEYLFLDSGLERIVIPEGILKINARAFAWCTYLSDLVLPESLTSIGTSAFEHCYSLIHITIPNNVTSIGAAAFYIDADDQAWVPGYGLTSLSLGKGVESIGAMAFRGHYDLREVTIPASTTYIGLDAFGTRTAFFDGPAPEVQSVQDEWWNVTEPLAYHIHVWPRHLESFEEDHPVLSLSKIIVRDTSPKIASLTLEAEKVAVSITGAPDTVYTCKTSDDLAEFRLVATDPKILMLDSTGKMEFSVQADLAGKFFIIEKSP